MDLSVYPTPPWVTSKNWNHTVKHKPWIAKTIINYKYKCADCGAGNKKLVVHHIDESRKSGKLNNNLKNLVPLCRSCHANRHGLTKHTSSDGVRAKLLDITGPDKVLTRGTLTVVSKECNLSRERIRQIAKQAGYTMSSNKNNKFYTDIAVCRNCGKKTKMGRRLVSSSPMIRKFCSKECYVEFNLKRYWEYTTCKQCGKKIKYLKSLSYKRPTFCSKICQGTYLGKNTHHGTNKKFLFKNVKDLLKDFGVNGFTSRDFADQYGYKNDSTKINHLRFLEKNEFITSHGTTRNKIYRINLSKFSEYIKISI